MGTGGGAVLGRRLLCACGAAVDGLSEDECEVAAVLGDAVVLLDVGVGIGTSWVGEKLADFLGE